MKGTYNFVQTVHTGPQGRVPVKVKHDYPGAVPTTEVDRTAAYLRQNGHDARFVQPATVPGEGFGLTAAQRRQLRRTARRATARATRNHYAGSWTAV